VTDTQSETIVVPADADGARPAVRRPRAVHRWWAFPMIGLAMVMLLAIGVAAVLPSSLVAEEQSPLTQQKEPTPYARTPASAEAVDDRITFGDIEGEVEQYPPSGDIYFVTVTEPSQSVLSWLVGRDEPAVQFLSKEEKYGLQTPQQRRVLALESMRSAEQVAQYVALRAVGYDARIVPGDVLIEQMVCLEPNDDGTACKTWSPSDEFLDPGDRLLAIDGVELHGVEDITELLAGKKPGDTVDIRVDRPDVGELTVTVELTQSPTEPERTIIGFVPFDTRRVELPFELDIDTGQIGGPSAGLAFTLTLIDELTPGELTGGGDVAVTGTIELDGTVGAIGGLRQKASAVAQAGVDVFIVPAAQGPDDIAAAEAAVDGKVRIIPVATLDEALAALRSLGGDPIETRPIATGTGG
jgi:Lon-like protease